MSQKTVIQELQHALAVSEARCTQLEDARRHAHAQFEDAFKEYRHWRARAEAAEARLTAYGQHKEETR